MSTRREARAATRTPTNSGGYPPQLASRLLPFWENLEDIVEVFGEYVHPEERASPIFTAHPRGLYGRVLSRWALAHGFESTTYPGTVDFRALRLAGVIDTSESPARLRAANRHTQQSP